MRYLISCLIVISVFSCESHEFEVLSEILNSVDTELLESTESIIVIPGEGCGGCISNATNYVRENIDRIESIIVFTGVGDLKLFKLQLGEDFLRNSKVIIDNKDHLMDMRVSSIYPREILLKNKRIQSVLDYSPEFSQ